MHQIHLSTPFGGLPELRQYQLRLDEKSLRVRLVLAPGAPREVLERVRAALVQALEAAGAVPPAVHVEPVEAIPRVGSGAKLTLVEWDARRAEPPLAS